VPKQRLPLYRVVRWAVQFLFLAAFVFLFTRTRYGVDQFLANLPLRFDPLVLLVTSIALRALVAASLPAIALVVLTLVFGRFFCGFICPLGTTIDLFDAVTGRKPRPGARLRLGKYLLLLFLLVAAALGSSLAGFFDPLVIFPRTLVLVARPVASGLLGHPLNYTDSFAALAMFAVILGLGFIAPRFWCRNICPLGGLLAAVSKFSLLKFSLTGECRSCGACAGVCPTGAIDVEKRSIDSAECIGCLACYYRCARHEVSYRVRFRPVPFDAGRREAIMAIGAGVIVAPLARSLVYRRLQARLIRPPGSLPEPAFNNACLRCGRCIKVCPTGALQPCIAEAGVAGLWTPRVVPRIGGCERNCNMCGQVCPTGAIRNLPLEEKSYARIGTAAVDRSRCLAWEQERACLVCDEACPYNAIGAFSDPARPAGPDNVLKPFVDERICVGCGICESRCPVNGAAAIQVFSIGEERKSSGPYKTDEKVRARPGCGTEGSEEVPSGFIQGTP
jgi:polyferredoxin